MAKAKVMTKTALWLAMAAIAANGHLFAQGAGESPLLETPEPASVPAQPAFSVEQVEQMVAPIALYPDALLAQILMAATYPIEVVQANQWLGRNNGLDGEALDGAVSAQPWDPSVKTLIFFPSVLERMAQDLTWTQDLGDAFLAQEADVMGAIQRLRRQAQEAGNLASNDQQIVRTQGSTIVVEPADPAVVYVPTYNPTTVYGPSWVPATTYYPSTYGYASAWPTWVVFGAGVVVGAILTAAIDWADDDYYVVYPRYRRHHHRHIHHVWYGYWDRDWVGPRYGGPAWRSYRPVYLGRGDVYIDNSRTINIDKTYVKREWEHDPVHRRSVSYRDPNVAKRFVEAASTPRVDRDAARPAELGSARQLEREAIRRLDRSQPALLPSDRGTREALQGDERERRERIMRGQRDTAPIGAGAATPDELGKRRPGREAEQRRFGGSEASPASPITRQPEAGQGIDAEAARRARETNREARTWGRPESGSTPAPSQAQERKERSQARDGVEPRQLQRSEPRPTPQRSEPQEAQRQIQRQWQQRAEPRSAPPQQPQQAQPQWSPPRSEPRPAPQRSEPQEAQRQLQRQWQQRAEPRQAPQAVEPRAIQQQSQRQWQPRPEPRQMPQRVEPQQMPKPVEAPRQYQQRAEPRPTPQPPVARQPQIAPRSQDGGGRQAVPQRAAPQESQPARSRENRQTRQRDKDSEALPR